MFLRNNWKIIVTLLHIQSKIYVSEDINEFIENMITTSINSTVEPCEDFYSYACGDYVEQNPSASYQEITTYMDHQYNTKVLNLMETVYQHNYQMPEHCQSFIEKARVYLRSCRIETKRNITRYFDDIKPGQNLDWPLLEKVTEISNHSNQWPHDKYFNIWSLLGRLQSYGLNNVLVNQEILVNSDGELSIMLEPVFTADNSTLPNVNILQVLLMGLGIERHAEVIVNLMKTENKLLHILNNYDGKPEDDFETTYGNLKLLYPNLNLCLYLYKLLGRTLSADTFILIRNPLYFQFLNDNMSLVFEKQQLCNYLMMKFLYFLAIDSTAEFNGMACIKDLRNKFDLAVNFLYYHHIYAPQANNISSDILNLYESITHMMGKYFDSNYLNLSNFQIQFMKNKLQQIHLNIGNLPQNVSAQKLEQFYAHVPPLDKNNYYKNHLLMLKHRFDKSLHYAQHETHFIATDNNIGSSSGAFYVTKQNMIILPFGSLMAPMYDLQYHDLFKYSLLGFILAHEITHAFDSFGLNFNAQGQESLQLTTILDNSNYQSSLNCLQSQLATTNIDERIADIVGAQIVFKLFLVKYNNLQPVFLNEKWNKYFYLNMAQFFCGKKNVQFIDHDSDADRLNQIVMNSQGFACAFRCPANSKMNPVEKCRLY